MPSPTYMELVSEIAKEIEDYDFSGEAAANAVLDLIKEHPDWHLVSTPAVTELHHPDDHYGFTLSGVVDNTLLDSPQTVTRLEVVAATAQAFPLIMRARLERGAHEYAHALATACSTPGYVSGAPPIQLHKWLDAAAQNQPESS